MSGAEGNWQVWVRKAEHDRQAIRSILAGDEVPWDVICFHAQQAAEKLLKGFLVFRGVQPSRTHDLVALLRECSLHAQGLVCLLADCQFLTAFAVHACYPDDLGEPSEEDAAAARASLERTWQAVSRCLPGQGGSGAA